MYFSILLPDESFEMFNEPRENKKYLFSNDPSWVSCFLINGSMSVPSVT